MVTAVAQKSNPIFQAIGFTPTAGQRPLLDCWARFVLVSGGEQAGKSIWASKEYIKRCADDLVSVDLESEETLLYWLVAIDYDKTKREFGYILDDLTKLYGIRAVKSSKRIDPGYIEVHLRGRRKPIIQILTKSAKDPKGLAMEAPNGIVLCEASQLDTYAFDRSMLRTSPKRGWLIGSGTFEKGLPWFAQIITGWKAPGRDRRAFSLPSWTNTTLYPGGRNDPEILRMEREFSADFFTERIAGEPVPPAGLVFREFRPDIHIREIEYVPGFPVYLAIDPGYAGAYAVLAIQIINGIVHCIDEVYERGLVTEEMIEVTQNRPWYGDVSNIGVIDIAGYQHQAMAAPAEIWLAKTGIYLAAQKIPINDGTERLKALLKPNPITGEPGVLFSPDCKGIISEFGAAANPLTNEIEPYKWKTDSNGQTVGTVPEDKNNHSVKALWYFLIDHFGYTTRRPDGNKAIMRRH